MRATRLYLSMATIVIVLTGCQGMGYMPTPNLYTHGMHEPFPDLPEGRKQTFVDVTYVTDRAPLDPIDSDPNYGAGRSTILRVGSARVEFGDDINWEKLEELSMSSKGSRGRIPHMVSAVDVVHFPDTHTKQTVQNGRVMVNPEFTADFELAAADFNDEISRRCAEAYRQEVYVYIHGYNVGFEESVTVMAELYHFLGREGIPISYSWPAGSGGLRGYSTDRESGEFSTYHLKQFLQLLASNSDVEKIHLITHSRGTDIAFSALRELHQFYDGAGLRIGEVLKLGNVVFIAPDVDGDVFHQRVSTEMFLNTPERVTFYLSPKDRALRMATWIFRSSRRLGQIVLSDLSPRQKTFASQVNNFAIIDTRMKKTDANAHSYFYSNPAVSSDLILLLRYDRDPGTENGRPLDAEGANFWLLNEPDYPLGAHNKLN